MFLERRYSDMKKRLGIVIAIVLALIVCSLLIWRLWPHSFEDVISTDESNITSLACTTSISGLNGDGTTFISSYELQSLGKDEEEFTAVLDILKSCEYRQDFQNLFPWEIASVESDSSRAVQVFLIWGNNESDTCYLVFHEDGQVVVSLGVNNGFNVYHAIDDSILDRLVDYIQNNGVEN